MTAKLNAALAECRPHAATLAGAMREAELLRPVTAERAQSLDDPTRRLLDQLAYRFTKLQDTLGEKVLPGLLERAEEPLAPDALFGEKLQRLERLGAIPSADAWRVLREVRNAIAHEYPDQPAIQAAMIERLLDATDELLRVWTDVEAFANRLGASP
jgi:hypothetical protein